MIQNGSFENNNSNGWDSSNINFTINNNVVVLTFLPSDSWIGFFGTTYPIASNGNIRNIFYTKILAKVPSDSYGFGFGIQELGGYVFASPSIKFNNNEYTTTSAIINPSSIVSKLENIYFGIYHKKKTVSIENVYINNVIVIDLTATFGSGNEPDKDWCDKHINYFDGTTTIYK